MTQPYYFLSMRTSGAFEVKLISCKTITAEQAKQWYEYYSKSVAGDVRIVVATEIGMSLGLYKF